MTYEISAQIFTTTAWVMGGLGLLVFLGCLFVLLRDLSFIVCRGRRIRSCGDTVAFLMKLLLPWPPLARALDLLISGGSLLDDSASSQPWITVFFGTMPGYMYVIIYLLLVLFWAWLYTSSKSTLSFRHNVLLLWSIIAATILLTWTLFMMDMAAFPDNRSTVHDIWTAIVSLLSVMIAILFIVWSIALVLRLRQRTQPSERTLSIATKIFILTLGCSALFFLRGITTLLNSFLFNNGSLALYISRWVLFVGCDYGSALFLLAIIFIRTKRVPRASSQAYLQYLHPEASQPYSDGSSGLAWEPPSVSSSSISTGDDRGWPVNLNTSEDLKFDRSGSFEDPFSSSDEESSDQRRWSRSTE